VRDAAGAVPDASCALILPPGAMVRTFPLVPPPVVIEVIAEHNPRPARLDVRAAPYGSKEPKEAV
jgi:hypothetical protein